MARLQTSMGRRDFMGAASLLLGGLAAARVEAAVVPPSRQLFARTALAGNRIAARFERLPAGLRVPSTALRSIGGEERLSALRNPATLVSMWADWCAPCIAEMHDIGDLGARHRDGLAVIALLQASKLDLKGAKAKLDAAGASAIPNWIEPNGGASIVVALGTPVGDKGFTLPCNLLVDRHGRVRGHAFGVDTLQSSHPAKMEAGRAGEPIPSRVKSAWELPAADQFARALAAGLLDHV